MNIVSVSRPNGGRVGNDHRACQKKRDPNSIPDREEDPDREIRLLNVHSNNSNTDEGQQHIARRIGLGRYHFGGL